MRLKNFYEVKQRKKNFMIGVPGGIEPRMPAWQANWPPVFGIFYVYIMLPLPLLKANRNQANLSALQAKRGGF